MSFATAPSWDSGDRSFTVALIDHYHHAVETLLVPVYYGYDGSTGFTITYPNSDNYYNDYFDLSNPYTVAIYPADGAYPITYLGGTTSVLSATQLDLSLPTSMVDGGQRARSVGSEHLRHLERSGWFP